MYSTDHTINALDSTPDKGYTLVELLVASSLLGIAVTGIMSMLATAREFEAESGIRQQAIMFATSVLESPLYAYENYPLPVAPFTPILDTLRHSTGDTILATQTRTVTAPQTDVGFTDFLTLAPTKIIPYQKVTVKLSWSMLGRADSVVLVKRVAQVE